MKFGSHTRNNAAARRAQKLAASLTPRVSTTGVEEKAQRGTSKKIFVPSVRLNFGLIISLIASPAAQKRSHRRLCAAFSHAQNWSRGGRCLHTQIDPASAVSIVRFKRNTAILYIRTQQINASPTKVLQISKTSFCAKKIINCASLCIF